VIEPAASFIRGAVLDVTDLDNTIRLARISRRLTPDVLRR
jgi:hypothetical protein